MLGAAVSTRTIPVQKINSQRTAFLPLPHGFLEGSLMNHNSRRILCCVLSFLILFSLVTPSVSAEEQDSNPPASGDAVVGSLPPSTDAANSDGTVTPAEEESLPEEEPLPEKDEPAEPSESLLSLRELIAALPAADGVAGMGEEDLNRLSGRITQILDLYDALSQEEQALVDLSPLEALYSVMDAQALADEPLSFSVTYSPTTLKCGVPVKFTLTSSDGIGQFKYFVGSIMVKTNSGVYFELDRTKKATLLPLTPEPMSLNIPFMPPAHIILTLLSWTCEMIHRLKI